MYTGLMWKRPPVKGCVIVRVLFISGERPTYTRNAVLIKGLKENGVSVIECTNASSSYAQRYPAVVFKYVKNVTPVDVIFVGFFGQPLVPLIRKMTRKPIVFDAFLSGYDTMCFDRKKCAPGSTLGKFFFWLDKTACDCADKVLLDTTAHINYFVETFKVDQEKFERVFVGADDTVFYPRAVEKSAFTVFHYGTYRPLQGIEYIVKAAALLTSDIHIKIVGKGQEHKKVIGTARALNVCNVEFIDWIPYNELPLHIANADICLGGHFSDIDKGKRVIAGKTFQFIAMRKPVIVGDNPANKELLDETSALFVEHANAKALAETIATAQNENMTSIAEKGYTIFKKRCTPAVIGAHVKKICEGVL